MAISFQQIMDELHQEAGRVVLDLSYPERLGRTLRKLGATQNILDLYDAGMLTETEAGFALCQLEDETP
jgi:hypothetical protein